MFSCVWIWSAEPGFSSPLHPFGVWNDGLLAEGDLDLHVVSFVSRGSVFGLVHLSCVWLQWWCRQKKKVGRKVIKNTTSAVTVAVTIKVAVMAAPISGQAVTSRGTVVYIKNNSSI